MKSRIKNDIAIWKSISKEKKKMQKSTLKSFCKSFFKIIHENSKKAEKIGVSSVDKTHFKDVKCTINGVEIEGINHLNYIMAEPPTDLSFYEQLNKK